MNESHTAPHLWKDLEPLKILQIFYAPSLPINNHHLLPLPLSITPQAFHSKNGSVISSRTHPLTHPIRSAAFSLSPYATPALIANLYPDSLAFGPEPAFDYPMNPLIRRSAHE